MDNTGVLSTQETFGGLVGAASKSVTLRDPCSIIPFESCSYRINMELDSCLVEDSLGVVAASGKIPTAELLLTCSAIQLEEAAFSCFLGSNVLDDVTGLKADTLQAFIKRVAASYTIAPYHNFCHAVTVLAAAATLVRTCTIKLDTLDRFMLLLAAICHDLEHPGIPNVELVRRGSAWVDQYGADSVLEKRSCASFEEILAVDGCNVLECVDELARASVVTGVVKLILATDITNAELHTSMNAQFEEMLKELALSAALQSDTQPLLTLFMLCADLGVLVGSFDVFLAWGRKLFQEIKSWNPSASASSFAAAQSVFLTQHPAHIFEVLSQVPGCASYGSAFKATAAAWAALGIEAQHGILSSFH